MTVFACSRNSQPHRAYAFLRVLPDSSLAFETSFDDALVAALKASIPYTERRYDKETRRWIVDASHAQTCADLAERYLGVKVLIPHQNLQPVQVEQRLFRLEYLGRSKDRSSGERSAFGWADGGWNLIFAEQALREWFEAIPPTPGEQPTLYAALGVKADATTEGIKTAYRRLAKIWHPDVNRDPDAPTQFRAVTDAYDVLRDPLSRRKYDVGRQFEASARGPEPLPVGDYRNYRAPLVCGYVLVEGKSKIGQFVVSKILQWESITNEQGLEMISFWPAGADHFEVDWR